jgi:hypothetical protein
MANFDKFAGQSPHGWDKKAGVQTLRPGSDARIGLWGGGPAGEDLTVSAADPSICTVHELPRPGAPLWRIFAITALREGDTQIRAVLPATTNAWATMQVHVTHAAAGVRLVFFPGERLAHGATVGAIYVIGGKGESFEAAGGPPTPFKDRGGHTGEPTPVGHYMLGPKRHVVAPSWPKSAIPYGAALRLHNGECEYADDAHPGDWHLATGPSGVVTQAAIAFKRRDGISVDVHDVTKLVRNIFIDPTTGTLRFTEWKMNDFGRWGWNLMTSRGGTAYFIHTTPDDEAATEDKKAFFLANSHGCIHIRPNDRDTMISLGYLKQGVGFEVRSYDEKGPP